MPIWAFHGAKDPIVPLRRSEELVTALGKSAGSCEADHLSRAFHDSWTATYDNPEVYEWLLAQKRPQSLDVKPAEAAAPK